MANLVINPSNLKTVTSALSSDTRISILQLLHNSPLSVTEISEQLHMPVSSAISAVIKLEEAGLINTHTKGKKKICSVEYQDILLHLSKNHSFRSELDDVAYYTIPVGDYCDHLALPSCGLLGEKAFIGPLDESKAFLSPNRVFAKLVWLRKGFLQYRFSKPKIDGKKITGISISMEICSEFPGYRNDFPSEISLSLNGICIGTWLAKGDYGGRYGIFTPKWWGLNNTQYGDLVTCTVTQDGSFINNRKTSDVLISDLNLSGSDYITFKVATDSTGGFNLFGKGFGDYNQDIAIRVSIADDDDINENNSSVMPSLPDNADYDEYIQSSIARNIT